MIRRELCATGLSPAEVPGTPARREWPVEGARLGPRGTRLENVLFGGERPLQPTFGEGRWGSLGIRKAHRDRSIYRPITDFGRLANKSNHLPSLPPDIKTPQI